MSMPTAALLRLSWLALPPCPATTRSPCSACVALHPLPPTIITTMPACVGNRSVNGVLAVGSGNTVCLCLCVLAADQVDGGIRGRRACQWACGRTGCKSCSFAVQSPKLPMCMRVRVHVVGGGTCAYAHACGRKRGCTQRIYTRMRAVGREGIHRGYVCACVR